MKKNSCILLVGVLGFGVVVLVLFFVFWLVKKEPLPQEPSGITLPPLNPILITITSPAEGGIFPLNGSVPVLVELASEQPLQGIRFWLDGIEIGAALPDVPAISAGFGFPSTLLKGEGWHSLYAGAVDQTGRVTLSNVVHVKSSPPVGMETIYITEPGDTLNSIAATFQADPDKMQTRNSGWSGGAADPLPVGKAVIIPFDPPVAPPQAEPAYQGPQVQFSSSLPRPPSIQAQADQCMVTITLQDLAKDASGFVLYRLDSDKNLFAPIASFNGSQVSPLVYQDKAATGSVQYVASAYNDQGESLGDPVAIALTDPGCINPSTLPVSGSIVFLPPSSNGTYFYVSVDGNGYERYPASAEEFLTLKDGTFDLRGLTSSDGDQAIPSGVAVEAWGWDSGQLSYLGNAQARIEIKPGLWICPFSGQCGGELTQYSESAVVDSDQENQSRKFRWNVVSPLAENYSSVLLQLSLKPFPAGSQEDPPGLVYSKILSGEVSSEDYVGGNFILNFKDLAGFFATSEDQTADPGGGLVDQSESPYLYNPWLVNQYEKNNPDMSGSIFLQIPEANLSAGFPEIPVMYYARIIPLSGGKLVQSPSNVVTIEYKPLGTSEITISTKNKNTEIYDIEYINSVAPIPPSAHWGCVDVIAVNPDSLEWIYPGWFNGRLTEFENYLNNHTPYCPVPWRPEEKAWYEDLWDWVNEGLDFINKVYQAAKKLSIDSMLAQYDLIGGWELCPLPDCRDKVFAGLMKGQEWVLKETYGLPSEIPNLNQLTDQGIDALAEEALKYAGLDGESCPKEILDCKKIIADALHKLKEEFVKQSVASYQNDDIAHSQGYYALPLPQDPTAITVEPAKTQNWQMAEATIRVTRKPGATGFTEQQLEMAHFTLLVDVYAVNQNCRNMNYTYCVNINTKNGAQDYCNEESVVLEDKPCEGYIFSGDKGIPLLAPGESKVFTIHLHPQIYWNPAMPEEDKSYNPYGDFDLLYNSDAQAEINVNLLSYSYLFEGYDVVGSYPFTLTNLIPSNFLGGH